MKGVTQVNQIWQIWTESGRFELSKKLDQKVKASWTDKPKETTATWSNVISCRATFASDSSTLDILRT